MHHHRTSEFSRIAAAISRFVELRVDFAELQL